MRYLVKIFMVLLAWYGTPAAMATTDWLPQITQYLNAEKTWKAQFDQLSPSGALSEGIFYLSRPGHLRFEYTKPEDQLMIADGKWLIHYDKSADEETHLALAETPAELLLRDPVRFDDASVKVVRLSQEGKIVRLELQRVGQEDAGSLTLVFNVDPLRLVQWVVVDAQKQRTVLNLKSLDRGVTLDPKLFVFTKAAKK